MKRKLLVLSLVVSMLMTTEVNAQTITDSSTNNYDLAQVERCIDDFFYVYEDVENVNDANDSMNIIEKMASKGNKDIFARANARNQQALGEESYLNTVQYMLQRREYIENVSDIDEKEYNKKLDIDIKKFNEQTDCLEVVVEVYKTWNYSFSEDIESAARDTYTISLIKENGNYVIQNIIGFGASIFDEQLKTSNDSISQTTKNQMMNELKSSFAAEVAQHTVEIKLDENSAVPMATSTYDGGAASSYALKYALNYNTNYANFNGQGGDCTNFISQCLKAGGISQHVGTAYSGNCWFYKTSTNRSSTWTGAEQFRKYVTGSSSKINMPTSSWGSVTFGDIIQLMSGGSAYHSLIVSGVAYGSSGRSDILVCCHTADRRHVSLNSNFSGSTKKYYHVKGNK